MLFALYLESTIAILAQNPITTAEHGYDLCRDHLPGVVRPHFNTPGFPITFDTGYFRAPKLAILAVFGGIRLRVAPCISL